MKNNKSTIRRKILLVAIAPAFCLAVLLLFYFISLRSHDVEQSQRREISNLATYISKNSEFDLLTGNLGTLKNSLERISQERDIVYLQIFDKNNKLVASFDKRSRHATLFSELALQPKHLFEVSRPIIVTPIAVNDYDLNAGDNQRPVNSRTQIIGRVIIGATDIFTEKMKRQMEIQAVSIMGIAIILTIIFAIFLANTVSAPLTLLARGIEKIKSGNLQHRIKEHSGGEIGLLESNINDMASSLLRAQTIERRQAANILQSERLKAHTTLESIGEGVITTNEHATITYINPAATRLTGFNYEESVGKPLDAVFNTYFESGQEHIAYPITSCLEHGHVVRHDALLKLVRKDGEEFIIRDTATPIRDHNDRIVGAVVIFDDFSALHAMAEKLVYQAAHDDLTGLYNRREFENQLDLAMNESRQTQIENAVMFLDLDQFKVVNDSCGHAAGDQLLKQISQLMQSRIRTQDILARLGGDEFGIILRNCPEKQAVELSKGIIDIIQAYVFYWGNQQFNIGACIGMVMLNSKFINNSDVLMAADSACYLAKEAGRNSLHIYQPTDKEQQKKRSEVRWVQRLKTALDKDQFVLYAQKIHPLKAVSQPEHYEILLRLDLEDNIYTPMTFMSSAERYNLMPEVDRWVIHEIFSKINHADDKLDHSGRNIRFNINLSGQSLTRDDFQKFVYDTVLSCKCDRSLITFEITETATIANMAHAIEFMKTLKQMGCQFALDDFGSGLSSFGYLTTLPLDYIKIDGKIVREITTNPINLSIVESINQIAHIMELKTIAEFVDSETIVRKLQNCNIDYAQGFYLDTPAPLQTILHP